MAVKEIFTKISDLYVNGIIFHSDMSKYFDFLNLHGFKRLHQYRYFCESKENCELQGYYINRFQELLPETESYSESPIPQSWHKYKRSDVSASDKANGVKAGFEKWLNWEKSVRTTLQMSAKELRNLGECEAACEVECMLCDNEEEIKRAERMFLMLKSVDFSPEYIEEIQPELHKKYKKKLKNLFK